MLVLTISGKSQPNIPNLRELQESIRQQGGTIVCYYRMWSLLVFSKHTPVFVWVAPGSSRVLASLPHVGFTAALGWWSLPGCFATPFVIVSNLAGGEEVTKRLMNMSPITSPAKEEVDVRIMGIKVPSKEYEAPAATDTQDIDPLVVEEACREQKRQSWIAGILLGLIFVASMAFFAYTQFTVR